MRFSGRMWGCRINESQACRLRPAHAAQPKGTTMARYDERARDALAEDFERDGFVLLPSHFQRAVLDAWRAAFQAA
ncbi:MAG: hypothetical protein CBCREVIR_1814 [Candidatus Burkholderia crenata]|nr:MAG: hypothetical protein CBCREVIR_1814 [Candidatus Burkholderia crenata]